MSNAKSDPRINLNLYRVFDAVYQSGSLTRAAERLHITQPAVSHALAQLREHYGDALFVRDGRRTLPTATAQGIAGPIREALHTLEELLPGQTGFDPATSTRRFVIGMRDAIEPLFLPPLLDRLRRDGPALALHSVGFERGQMTRRLASGEIDLVVDIAQPGGGGELRSRLLLRDAFRVVMRDGHPLARTKLALDDWLAADHVAVSARAHGRSLQELILQEQGLACRFAARCQTWQAACDVVAATDLVALIPASVAERYGSWLDIRSALPPIPMPALEIALYWHPGADDDGAIGWLIARMEDLAGLRRTSA